VGLSQAHESAKQPAAPAWVRPFGRHGGLAVIDPFRSLAFLHTGRLRAAVWTGDARDTRPTADSRLAGIRRMGFMNFVPLIGAYFPSAA
jgi:hypothetical protein